MNNIPGDLTFDSSTSSALAIADVIARAVAIQPSDSRQGG